MPLFVHSTRLNCFSTDFLSCQPSVTSAIKQLQLSFVLLLFQRLARKLKLQQPQASIHSQRDNLTKNIQASTTHERKEYRRIRAQPQEYTELQCIRNIRDNLTKNNSPASTTHLIFKHIRIQRSSFNKLQAKGWQQMHYKWHETVSHRSVVFRAVKTERYSHRL
jgi:hypothetical protein